jgi:hypothetical protein
LFFFAVELLLKAMRVYKEVGFGGMMMPLTSAVTPGSRPGMTTRNARDVQRKTKAAPLATDGGAGGVVIVAVLGYSVQTTVSV